MSLVETFLAHVPEDRRAHFAVLPDLETSLSHLAEAGQRAWPEIRLDRADFIAFLGRCLPEGAASDLASLRAGDLYLVCAYGLGIDGASQALEERCMSRVAIALSRLGMAPSVIADIEQDLRQRLLEMRAPRPDQKVYAGRGDITGWLCVTAVREAGACSARRGKELSLEESGAMLLASPGEDPEMAYLQRVHKEEMQLAFRDALASMPARERNLLRYYFLEGLSIDRIGLLYDVHRATAARWVNRARETLCERTRENFCARVSVSQAGFQRMLGLIESQIGVHLAAAPD